MWKLLFVSNYLQEIDENEFIECIMFEEKIDNTNVMLRVENEH